MLVLLSLYVMLSILVSILACVAASLFWACLVMVQVSAPQAKSYIDRNKDSIVTDRMVSNMLEENTNEFWIDVDVKNRCKPPYHKQLRVLPVWRK